MLSIVILLAERVYPLATRVPFVLDRPALTPFDTKSFVMMVRSPSAISILASISTRKPACNVRSDELPLFALIAESTNIVWCACKVTSVPAFNRLVMFPGVKIVVPLEFCAYKPPLEIP